MNTTYDGYAAFERLETMRGWRGFSKALFARELQRQPQSFTNWAERGFPSAKVTEAAAILDVDPEWLMRGRGGVNDWHRWVGNAISERKSELGISDLELCEKLNLFGNSVVLPEEYEREEEDKKDSGFETPFFTPNLIRIIEAGNDANVIEYADALADALGVDFIELVRQKTGTVEFSYKKYPPVIDEMRGKYTTTSVEGLAACGEMGFEEAGLNLLKANLPPGCSNRTFALLAVGTSLDPLGLSAGHLCFCDPEVDADIGDIVFLEINNDASDEPSYLDDPDATALSDHRFSLKKLYKVEQDIVVVYGYKRGKELPSIGKYGKESQEMFFSEIARKNIVRMVAVSWINARPRIV